jgi:hypothetical protein
MRLDVDVVEGTIESARGIYDLKSASARLTRGRESRRSGKEKHVT